MEPVRSRDVALGYGDEAREPCFGGEQIVITVVGRRIVDAIADREKLTVRIEEKSKIHLGDQAARAHGELMQSHRVIGASSAPLRNSRDHRRRSTARAQ